MIELQTAIFARLNGDSVLQSLLGRTDGVVYGLQNVRAKAPCITFEEFGATLGKVNTDNAQTEDEGWQINIYANNAAEVVYRIRVLLDNYVFPASGNSGAVKMQFDVMLPTDTDQDLKVLMKTIRYRAYFAMQPVALI